MTIRERFMIGLYLSSGSFWLLWLHKKLLVYLSFLLIVFYAMPLFVRGFNIFWPDRSELWSYNFAFDAGFFVYIYLLTFLLVALIKHTMEIIHGNVEVSVRRIVSDTAHLWPQIFVWSLLFTLLLCGSRWIIMAANYLPSTGSLIVNRLVGVLFIGFMVGTIFILPIIAVEKTGVFNAIKKSFKLVSIVFVEIMAAVCWFLIIGLGLIMILMIINSTSSPYLAFLLFWVGIIGYYLLYSAIGVTQALLYQRSTRLLR